MTKKKSKKWKGGGKKQPPVKAAGKKGDRGGKLKKSVPPPRSPAPPRALALPGARLPLWAACAIVLVVAVVPYLNIFQNEFVSYDDEEYILQNKTIRSLDAEISAGCSPHTSPAGSTRWTSR